MVRKAVAKKRRAGRYGKTKLKNRSWNRWDPKPKVDQVLRDKWDVSKSRAENMKRLGLLADPNSPPGADNVVVNSCPLELFDIPDSDAPTLRQRFPLKEQEEQYISKCLERWGDDYQSIFKDIHGVNSLQYTEDKLRKLGSRYLLLSSEQRRIEVPEEIKRLLPLSSPEKK